MPFPNSAEIKRLASDLTTIEINTIISDGIMGRSPFDTRRAFFDVGKTFESTLSELKRTSGFAESHPDSSKGPTQVPTEPTGITAARNGGKLGSQATFDKLAQGAREVLEFFEQREQRGKLKPVDRAILARIKFHSAELASMLARANDPNKMSATEIAENHGSAQRDSIPLQAMDLVNLRKIWEIGVETVVLQTTVGISGDVTTRVLSGFDGEKFANLHRFHHEGTEVATRTWQALVGAVAEFGKSLLGHLG